MLGTIRRPFGDLLASVVTGRGDLSADARLMGATQARVPVPPVTGATPGRGHLLASLFAGPEGQAVTPAGVAESPIPPAGAPGPSRGQMMADMLAGGSDVPEVATSTAKPKFFDKDGGHRQVLGILGDMLAGAAGQPPRYAQMMEQQRSQAAEWGRVDRQRQQDRGWAVEDRDAKLNAPERFMSGRDRVQYNPATGESSVVFDGPEDYQTYADTLGFDPADEGYQGAVQDYVLRANGPTSQRARQGLETQRLEGRLTLKGTPTYAATHPRERAGGNSRSTSAVIAPLLQKMSRGIPLTQAEQATLNYTRPSGRARAPASGGAAPAVGTVRGGFQFKGGDPANRTSWVKVGRR